MTNDDFATSVILPLFLAARLTGAQLFDFRYNRGTEGQEASSLIFVGVNHDRFFLRHE